MSWLNAIRRVPSFLSDALANRRRRDVMPRLLTYTVTFRCNARCIMCDSWKMSGQGDLELREIESIFSQLPRMDAVRLTGGEPFVRTDLTEIVGLVERYLKPLAMHITTNGFLTDRIVELCERRSRKTPLQLMVSLDGLKEKHNHIRGSSLAFQSAVKTLNALAPRVKELKLDLVVNQTIVDRDGVDQYRQLREFLKPLGVRHQMVMAYDSSATYSVDRNLDLSPREMGQFTTFGEFQDSELRELFDEVERDLQSLPWWARAVKKYYLRGIRQRLLPDENPGEWQNPACVALHSHLRLFPNGDVPTCQFNSKVIGNLRNESFETLWLSRQAQTQREWVRRCVGCWAECEVVPSAVYSLDLLKPRRASSAIAAGIFESIPSLDTQQQSELVTGNWSEAERENAPSKDANQSMDIGVPALISLGAKRETSIVQ